VTSRQRVYALRACFVVAAASLLVACASARTPGAGGLPARGHQFDDCSGAAWCPRMVAIPAGEFDMGAPVEDSDRTSMEGPVHHVRVHAFALGKFDVTRGQWAAFVDATHRPTRTGCWWTGRTGFRPDSAGSWRDPGFEQDSMHPAVCVTWYDAQDYVAWLSARTGKPYRLPSEAEWEYAARAGSATAYPWGTLASHDRANYGADKCCGPRAVGADIWVNTSPAAAFPPNAFGLYDMHGNVLQWLADCLAPSYDVTPVDGSAYASDIPLQLSGRHAALNGQPSCSFRVVRGGDWGDPPSMVRSAFRNFGPGPGATLRDYSSAGVGFRVARSID
jgi:formylglycine-generating enzyme required for sulfatase activity